MLEDFAGSSVSKSESGFPFFIFLMGEFSGFNGNSHFYQKGEDEKTRRPNSEGDHEFQEIRDIVGNLS